MFSDTAQEIAKSRYLQGNEECIEDMFSRVANALANVEKDDVDAWRDKFYSVMYNKQFLPAGRTLANAGTEHPVVANCVVLPIYDSMESIGQTLKDAMLLQQQGCGLGFNFSHLRPAGYKTHTSNGVASGPVSFMRIYNTVFSTIKQQGRHGANMGILNIYHPDIIDFITCKEIEGELNNFNISVLVTDKFMKIASETPDKPFMCEFNDKKVKPRNVHRQTDMFGTKEVVEEIDITYGEILNLLAKYAHKNGEPGILFYDMINKTNPAPGLGDIITSNPCVSGDTWISTTGGLTQVKDLIGKQFEARIENNFYLSSEKGFFKTGRKDVYRLVTENDNQVKVTKDHKIRTTNGWKEAQNLTKEDTILLHWDVEDKLKSFSFARNEPVYDCVIPDIQMFEGNGFILHNCGEQNLHFYDNCNLGSINVAEFVKENTSQELKVDYTKLSQVVDVAVRMLDNTIDLFDHSVPAINDMAKNNRRIGLGIMGFADLLFKLNIRYGSVDSTQLARDLMDFINWKARMVSQKLGKNKGYYPNRENGALGNKYVRNVARTSIAPTGSISMLLDVNSGIEPYFSLAYKKKIRAGEFDYVSPDLIEALEYFGYDKFKIKTIVDNLMSGISLEEISRDIIEMPINVLESFVTSMDIGWQEHISVQEAFQYNTDNSISKTINFPESALVQDIINSFIYAWKHNCKSITVYRNKSRVNQVLTTVDDLRVELEENNYKGNWDETKTYEEGDVMMIDDKLYKLEKNVSSDEKTYFNFVENPILKRPQDVYGKTIKIVTAHGNMYIVINYWEHNGELKPFEVFTHIGKEGGDLHSYMSAITRMVSMALRSGVQVTDVIEQLRGISCHVSWDNGQRIEGPVDAIAYALAKVNDSLHTEKYVNTKDVEAKVHAEIESKVLESLSYEMEMASIENGVKCPECFSQIVNQEGCLMCPTCGWSKC